MTTKTIGFFLREVVRCELAAVEDLVGLRR